MDERGGAYEVIKFFDEGLHGADDLEAGGAVANHRDAAVGAGVVGGGVPVCGVDDGAFVGVEEAGDFGVLGAAGNE